MKVASLQSGLGPGQVPLFVFVRFYTDYPHSDSKYPHATDSFLYLPLNEESKRKVLWDNCARLYKLSG